MSMIKSFAAMALCATLAFSVVAPAPALAQGSQHDQIVAHYGGEYDPNGLGRYVRQIVDRLEPHADLDRPIRHVTVLNSPVINAFATPEGGVYVTRGIIALCNSEDELAGIIGHEIGHVAEAHGQGRQGVSILAGVLGMALEAAGIGEMGMLGYNVGANLGLNGYSRGQEEDSDRLGVRYLHRAGYDPYALHDFFQSMHREARLTQTLAGQETSSNRMDFFSTHPNTEGRMEAVYNRAQRKGVAEGEIPRIVNPFLDEIDGMLYGDGDDQGFVRGRNFYHTQLGFTYEVPVDYTIQNGTESVVAFHDDGSAIIFDLAQHDSGRSMSRYVEQELSSELGIPLDNVQGFRVNGIPAASGQAIVNQNGQQRNVFAVAYDAGNGRIYRFIMSGPRNNKSNVSRGWIDTMDSFRRLDNGEVAGLHSLTIDVVNVRRRDTVERLANRMAFDDYRIERFRALNGLGRNGTVERGERVKLVVE